MTCHLYCQHQSAPSNNANKALGYVWKVVCAFKVAHTLVLQQRLCSVALTALFFWSRVPWLITTKLIWTIYLHLFFFLFFFHVVPLTLLCTNKVYTMCWSNVTPTCVSLVQVRSWWRRFMIHQKLQSRLRRMKMMMMSATVSYIQLKKLHTHVGQPYSGPQTCDRRVAHLTNQKNVCGGSG